MAGPPDPTAYVDLTVLDDSLSKLSDEQVRTAPSGSKSKAKAKSSSSSSLKKSASASNIATKQAKGIADATVKTKPRKSEPIAAKTTNGDHKQDSNAKGKQNENGLPPRAPPSAPISDVIRARTHVNCEGNPPKLCHQHHQPCKGALLECTFMRAPGKRCQGRYCFSSLRRFYDQDPETIVKSNRMMINPAEHCPPSETKYAWKCPRCRGKCVCSTCRKAAGLEPLGKWIGGKKKTKAELAAEAAARGVESSKAKADKGTPDDEKAKGKQKAADKTKGKDRSIAEAVAAQKNGKGKSKASAAADEEDDGITTPPPSGNKPAAKKTLASVLNGGLGVKKTGPAFKPLKAPAEVAPPTLQVIPTKLPEENMRARMWIYESMVRFDKFGLNRTVLSQLDKFDNWTHTMAQDMLACLLKTIAGLSHIDKGQPVKPFVKAIAAFRAHGKALQRGEPWSAATELLASVGLARTPLAFVEHDIPVEVEAAAAERSPSPLPASRVTRARRAKENKQYEIARQLSILDRWEEDEFGETASDAYDDDEGAPSRGRRRQTSTKKSIYVYDDPSDDESMADPDDSSRARRSGRARKPVQKEPAPEARLTGRQQAIKLQQEHQKEEEAAKQREEEEQTAAREVSSSRKRQSYRASNGSDSRSDASDDDESGDESNAQTNGRSTRKKRKFAVASSDDEAESDVEADAKSNGTVEDKKESRVEEEHIEMESPDLETKISILSALIDAAVMASDVAEELKTAGDNVAATERNHKAANAEMEKEIAEDLAELNKRAPSIVSPEYQTWKAEKAKLEVDIAWRRLDARVICELAIDTHALRTGPLGHDADGREYWHVREYQEKMPKYTEGRYAWCVVVLGKAFPADPNAKAQEEAKEGQDEAKKEKAENGDDSKAGIEAKDKGDDSGLTWSDGGSAQGEQPEADGDVKMGLATSAANGHKKEESIPETRICMGTSAPSEIKKLIEYITYRLEQVEYEENVGMQEREKVVRAAKDENADSRAASPSAGQDGDGANINGGVESMYSIRKAKQTLKDTQEERRKQVEQLVKRLNKSKEYFAWHREELPP